MKTGKEDKRKKGRTKGRQKECLNTLLNLKKSFESCNLSSCSFVKAETLGLERKESKKERKKEKRKKKKKERKKD